MKKTHTLTLIFSLFIIFLSGQESTGSGIQWAIDLPEGFNDNTLDTEAKNENSKTILLFQNGPSNYIDAVVQPFNRKEGNTYEVSFAGTCQLLYMSFKEQAPSLEIKSGLSKDKVGGLDFESCKISIENIETPVEINLYGRNFNDKELLITTSYTDENNKKSIKDALINSTFE